LNSNGSRKNIPNTLEQSNSFSQLLIFRTYCNMLLSERLASHCNIQNEQILKIIKYILVVLILKFTYILVVLILKFTYISGIARDPKGHMEI
jgi:hypothetical protein